MEFEIAIQALCDAGVDFIVIGGFSATLHGSAQVTYDLDLCYSRVPANLHRIAAVLAPFHPKLRGFPPELPFVLDERSLRNGTLFTLQTDIGPIDLLAEVAGIGSFEELRACAVTMKAFDRTIMTLNLRALIQSKVAAGRTKDVLALVELESLLEADKENYPD